MQNTSTPLIFRYILSPNLEVINKDAEAYKNTPEELDILGYIEIENFISLPINYFAKVTLTQNIGIESADSIDLNSYFEFQIYSPFDSMKNALNQITDFMKQHFCEKATWDIEEIKRISHLN